MQRIAAIQKRRLDLLRDREGEIRKSDNALHRGIINEENCNAHYDRARENKTVEYH